MFQWTRIFHIAALTAILCVEALGGLSITDGGTTQLTSAQATRIEVAADVWEVRLLQPCPPVVVVRGIPTGGMITTVVRLIEMRSTNDITLIVDQDLKRVERIRPAQPTDPAPFSNVGVLRLQTLRVDGDIGPESPASSFYIEAHAIQQIQTVEFSHGRLTGGVLVLAHPTLQETNIFSIQIDGDIRAPIHNPQGSIFKGIDSRTGSMIGSQVAGLFDVFAASFVGGIRVAQDMLNVKIGDPASPSFGITSSGLLQISGIEVGRDLTGSIGLVNTERLRVGRNMSAHFRVLETAATGTGSSEYIYIGNNFETAGLIELPANGLRDQVYINANLRHNQNPPSTGRWLGTIKVGNTTLTSNSNFPPSVLDGQYGESSASLGGGSVAVLPGRLKGTESTLRFKEESSAGTVRPVTENSSQVNVTVNKPLAGVDVLERVNADWIFYGLTRISSQGCFQPFEGVERVLRVFQRPFEAPPAGTEPSPWVEITDKIGARFFNTGFDGSSNPNQRMILMRGSSPTPLTNPAPYSDLAYQFTNGMLFKFEVNTTLTGGVSCETARTQIASEIPFNQPQSDSDRFTILVGNTCPTDFNGDGNHDTLDLTIFLGRFGNSAATITTGLVGDVNNDGFVNTIDLTKFLGKFGQACVPPSGEIMMEPSQGGGDTTLRRTTAGTTANAIASAMPTPPGPVLAALGYSSAEAYQAYVDTLSQEELKAHLILVLAVAQSIEGATP